MNLHSAVEMGRFCGLETVQECVLNIEMHAMNMFVYSDIPEQMLELHSEHQDYLAGDLLLDWNEIERSVEEQWKEYAKSVENKTAEPIDLGGLL